MFAENTIKEPMVPSDIKVRRNKLIYQGMTNQCILWSILNAIDWGVKEVCVKEASRVDANDIALFLKYFLNVY